MREPKTTVVIPTIPERATLLERAVSSVTAQSARCRIAVAEDSCDSGARATRQNGLETVTTEWVAFLDDDDELDPNHIEILLDTANRYKADFVWSRFRLRNDVKGTTTPGPYPLDVRAFEQWDDRYPVRTTITVLVRTDVALRAGGFHAEIDTTERLKYGQGAGEEFDFALRCRRSGAVFRHAPYETWTWHHWGGNTAGLARRYRDRNRARRR